MNGYTADEPITEIFPTLMFNASLCVCIVDDSEDGGIDRRGNSGDGGRGSRRDGAEIGKG